MTRLSTIARVEAEANARVIAGRSSLTQNLLSTVLPAWWNEGTDHQLGGYFEKRRLDGTPVEEPRRTRVVARQIFVFAVAKRLGWSGPADVALSHGASFLVNKLRVPEGHYAACVDMQSGLVNANFDLYEQAFALLALAYLQTSATHSGQASQEAGRLLDVLHTRYKHPKAGYHEGQLGGAPLRANPHMHLLEALIAWSALNVHPLSGRCSELADELCQLALNCLIHAPTGVLHEYFSEDWELHPSTLGQLFEPGHQYEWGWLLIRWGTHRNHSGFIKAGQSLIHAAESRGINPSTGLIFTEMQTGDMVTDGRAKLWPHTERIKAWYAMAACAERSEDRTYALDRCAQAIDLTQRFFIPGSRGLWTEVMDAQGERIVEPCRASSLYHIVCAVETLHNFNSLTPTVIEKP